MRVRSPGSTPLRIFIYTLYFLLRRFVVSLKPVLRPISLVIRRDPPEMLLLLRQQATRCGASVGGVLGRANSMNPAANGRLRLGLQQQQRLQRLQHLQHRFLGSRPTIQAKTNQQKERIATYVDKNVEYLSGAEFKMDVRQVCQVFSFWFIQSSLWFIVIRNYIVDIVPCNGPSMLPTVAQQDFLRQYGYESDFKQHSRTSYPR